VADLTPIKERLAKCVRLFGSAERANARSMTERALASVGASWTDLGDWIENSYSEEEMLELSLSFARKKEHARRRATVMSCCLRIRKWQTIALHAVVDWKQSTITSSTRCPLVRDVAH
jgi:hypothetical protein